MPRAPVDLPALLALVTDDRSVTGVTDYFRPAADPAAAPPYSGSRFERFAGGGDRPEVANSITSDDLVAVTLLSVEVPGPVALQLLEGPRGQAVAKLLAQVPTDVALYEPAAQLMAPGSPVRQAWELVEFPMGMGWVTAGKVIARKRPHLVPVYDNVVRCVLGEPIGVWDWLRGMLTADHGVLVAQLEEVRAAGGVPEQVSVLRVLDVILWMRHHTEHRR